eukprot:gene10027-11088_t
MKLLFALFLLAVMVGHLSAFTLDVSRAIKSYSKPSSLQAGSFIYPETSWIGPTPNPQSVSADTQPKNDVYEALGLPALTSVDLVRLSRGERIQRQSRDGRTGSGLVVVDVPAHPDVVFRTLQQFEQYHALIPTIRAAKIDRHSSGVIARAEYALSKFHLKVHVKHTIVPDKKAIRFSLDADKPNLVMRRADGLWFVEHVPEKPHASRVWLVAHIRASSLVPNMIIDYAASRALPRATTWLKPYFAGLPHTEDHSLSIY